MLPFIERGNELNHKGRSSLLAWLDSILCSLICKGSYRRKGSSKQYGISLLCDQKEYIYFTGFTKPRKPSSNLPWTEFYGTYCTLCNDRFSILLQLWDYQYTIAFSARVMYFTDEVDIRADYN